MDAQLAARVAADEVARACAAGRMRPARLGGCAWLGCTVMSLHAAASRAQRFEYTI